MENLKKWSEAPVKKGELSSEWSVATAMFKGAANIGIFQQSGGSTFDMSRKNNDERGCYLAGQYDPDYNSFHVERRFEDGERESIYDPAHEETPMDYRKVLGLMSLWQDVTLHNNRNAPDNARCDVMKFRETEKFDPIPYRKGPEIL